MADEVRRWALAVRVLTLLSGLLLIVVVLEGRTLRHARAELQQLRAERDGINTRAAATWARQSTREANDALRWLDTFYADAVEGFGRRGGLCAEGQLNTDAITSYLFEGFINARASGKSYEVALAEMRAVIVKSDAYRALHPDLSPQAPGK